MRIVKRQFEKDGSGSISLIADNGEDLWQLFNIIVAGDVVTADTHRKVQKESQSGAVDSQRITMRLSVKVDDTSFDTEALSLRVSGRVVGESKWVASGSHHAIDIESGKGRTIGITKSVWDSFCLTSLAIASDPTAKALKRFLDAIYMAVRTHVNFNVVKVLLIATPGFLREKIKDHIILEATRSSEGSAAAGASASSSGGANSDTDKAREILENKSKIVVCHSSSGHRHALAETMKDPKVLKRLEETKFAEEVRLLRQFYALLKDDDQRTAYGLNPVEKAIERGAVDTLLLTDSLFRNNNVAVRRRYVAMVEEVERSSGKVHIFSSQHMTGEGIAALLRFPVFDDGEGEDEADRGNVDSNALGGRESWRESSRESAKDTTLGSLRSSVAEEEEDYTDEFIYSLAEEALGLRT